MARLDINAHERRDREAMKTPLAKSGGESTKTPRAPNTGSDAASFDLDNVFEEPSRRRL